MGTDGKDTYSFALFSFQPWCSFHSEVASSPLGHRTHRLGWQRGHLWESSARPHPASQDLRRVCGVHRGHGGALETGGPVLGS